MYPSKISQNQLEFKNTIREQGENSRSNPNWQGKEMQGSTIGYSSRYSKFSRTAHEMPGFPGRV